MEGIMTNGWHKADINASLRKKGKSLEALSLAAGLSSSTFANVLVRPWPKGEFLIADELGVHPGEIWPERYFGEDGKLNDRERLRRTH
jgi:Ner family transcriptional regulator